jgi:hypothetical protein
MQFARAIEKSVIKASLTLNYISEFANSASSLSKSARTNINASPSASFKGRSGRLGAMP